MLLTHRQVIRLTRQKPVFCDGGMLVYWFRHTIARDRKPHPCSIQIDARIVIGFVVLGHSGTGFGIGIGVPGHLGAGIGVPDHCGTRFGVQVDQCRKPGLRLEPLPPAIPGSHRPIE
jgi:hypothetical protein